jgi:dolichol-phosphate mannosyltransferase
MLTSHSTSRAVTTHDQLPAAAGRAEVAAIARVAEVGASVVVPMFNERECVDQLLASLAKLEAEIGDRYDFEFVLVDDGSTDDTAALLEGALSGKPRYRVVRHGENRGIAAAIRTGLRSARHEVVVSMDCDGTYDAGLMAEMIPLLRPDVDLVTASPYHADGAVENVPLWRLRLSRLASKLYGMACRHKLSCYTSCFRVYRRSTFAAIDLNNEGFVGVAELLCKVLARGGVVVEHPALLRARTAGTSKMRVMRAGADHLKLMARILARRLFARRATSKAPGNVESGPTGRRSLAIARSGLTNISDNTCIRVDTPH